MKKTIAVFKYIDRPFPIETVGHQGFEEHKDKLRISEYVEIDFPDLPAADVVAAEVDQLDQQIAIVRDAAAQKLNELATRKAELLSLTHGPEAQL